MTKTKGATEMQPTTLDRLFGCFDLVPTFTVRLVLEVFGGAGAIWGFSEAVGLRTAQTIWFWRPAALSVGFLFFLRWIRQLNLELKKKCGIVVDDPEDPAPLKTPEIVSSIEVLAQAYKLERRIRSNIETTSPRTRFREELETTRLVDPTGHL